MSRDPGDSHEAASSELTIRDRAFLRMAFWQTVLSIAGVFTGVVALYVALTESEAVRQQTAAAVWPYVQLSVDDHVTDSDAHFALALTNAGVGPARLEGMRVQLAGTVVRNWSEAVDLLVPASPGPISQNSVIDRVLSPGERVELLATRDRTLVDAFRAAAGHSGTGVAFCYCSIFQRCWLADSRAESPRPLAVEECPDYGADAFRY